MTTYKNLQHEIAVKRNYCNLCSSVEGNSVSAQFGLDLLKEVENRAVTALVNGGYAVDNNTLDNVLNVACSREAVEKGFSYIYKNINHVVIHDEISKSGLVKTENFFMLYVALPTISGYNAVTFCI